MTLTRALTRALSLALTLSLSLSLSLTLTLTPIPDHRRRVQGGPGADSARAARRRRQVDQHHCDHQRFERPAHEAVKLTPAVCDESARTAALVRLHALEDGRARYPK